LEKAKSLEAAKKLQSIGSVDRRPGAETMNCAYCAECDHVIDFVFKSYRCATDTSVSTRNIKEYWISSAVSWSHRPISLHSHPSRRKQRACSVANVFSGSVATQLRWGGKLPSYDRPKWQWATKVSETTASPFKSTFSAGYSWTQQWKMYQIGLRLPEVLWK